VSVITFMTDFGLQDDFVGTCHGVIAGIAPDARVIDVTHGIAPQAVLQGALVLRNTTPYMPVGVHGPALDPAELVRVVVPDPELGRSQISATVLSVDRFGNIATNARRRHLDALGLENGDRAEVRVALDRYYAIVADTFADAPTGELILYEDSSALVTLAISLGDAARLTGADAGDELRIVAG
jgi:S-adenosylmethionine hydrolase